jgi:hypothetical protein
MTIRYWAGAAMLVVAAAANAQVAPEAIPNVGNFSLPASQPSPTPTARPFGPSEVAPTPTPTPAASPSPRPRPAATPTPRSTASSAPRPSATPTPRPKASPSPSAATPVPAASPTPLATPAMEPSAVVLAAEPSPAPTVAAVQLPPGETPARPGWLVPALLAALAIAGLALFLRRRRSAPGAEEADATETVPPALEPVPVANPVPAPAQPVVEPAAVIAAPRFLDRSSPATTARIDLDEPSVSRAGVNLVTATADVTVTVRNASDVPATGIALEVRLLSAQPGQDAVIAALFSGPVDRPAVARFDLAPGETKRVRTVATMPRDAITVLTAGDRPMFVPVVAIRAVHAGGQTTSVHAIGIERAGQAKLGPFWLDVPSRMYDAIGVRPHTGR